MYCPENLACTSLSSLCFWGMLCSSWCYVLFWLVWGLGVHGCILCRLSLLYVLHGRGSLNVLAGSSTPLLLFLSSLTPTPLGFKPQCFRSEPFKQGCILPGDMLGSHGKGLGHDLLEDSASSWCPYPAASTEASGTNMYIKTCHTAGQDPWALVLF